MEDKILVNLLENLSVLRDDLDDVTDKLKKLEIRIDGIHKTAINQNLDLNKISTLIKNFGSNVSREFYND